MLWILWTFPSHWSRHNPSQFDLWVGTPSRLVLEFECSQLEIICEAVWLKKWLRSEMNLYSSRMWKSPEVFALAKAVLLKKFGNTAPASFRHRSQLHPEVQERLEARSRATRQTWQHRSSLLYPGHSLWSAPTRSLGWLKDPRNPGPCRILSVYWQRIYENCGEPEKSGCFLENDLPLNHSNYPLVY